MLRGLFVQSDTRLEGRHRRRQIAPHGGIVELRPCCREPLQQLVYLGLLGCQIIGDAVNGNALGRRLGLLPLCPLIEKTAQEIGCHHRILQGAQMIL